MASAISLNRAHSHVVQLQFPGNVKRAVRDDPRRIAIVGARGWIGRTALALLHDALGPGAFAQRVICFGSQAGVVDISEGLTAEQRPLSELTAQRPQPTLLLHLAFLTMDKVANMDAGEYAQANRELSQAVYDALDQIGVDRLFVASSGAAAFADNPSAATELRLYGKLKRADEEMFAHWANRDPQQRRAAIGRIYSVSGPYINKHETYALAGFILDALAGRPIEVRAPMRVLRSYVAVRELVSLVFAMLLASNGSTLLRFETGGEALELSELAARVAGRLGGHVNRAPISVSATNRFVGDHEAWSALLAGHHLEHLPLDAQIAETAEYLAGKSRARINVASV